MKYTGTQLMETAPVPTAIIKLALPMMAAMLAQSIYSMIDVFFIGQTGNPNLVAAVSLVFPIYMLSQAFGNVFAIGSSSYISRMLGAKNLGEIKNTSSVCFYVSLITGSIIATLLLFFKTPILYLIGASEVTFSHADDYYSIIVLFMPFAVAGTLFSGLLRSEGATDKAMILQLVGIVFNIFFTPFFIFKLGLGIKGAALSTIIGQLLSFSYGVWYLRFNKTPLSITLKNFRPNKIMLKEVFSIGIPVGMSNLLMSVAAILGNRIAASHGDNIVAALGVQMRIASMCFMLVFALTMGYQPFAGFNYGAKNFERLKKGFIFTIVFSTILCCVGCLFFLIFGNELIRFFINDEQTIQAGSLMLRVFTMGLLFLGVQSTFMTTYEALGKSFEAMLVNLGRQLLFYVPLLHILNYFWGFHGFIFAMPLSDFFTAVLAVALGGSLFKIMRKDIKKH